MKKLITLLLLIASISSYAQITFANEDYLVFNANGDKIIFNKKDTKLPIKVDENYILYIDLPILSFKIGTTKGGVFVTECCVGNKFSPSCMKLLNESKDGTYVIIEEHKYKDKNGAIVKLPGMVFKVKKVKSESNMIKK